jgi:hypothetical protein
MVIPVPVVKLILAIWIGSGFDLIGPYAGMSGSGSESRRTKSNEKKGYLFKFRRALWHRVQLRIRIMFGS